MDFTKAELIAEVEPRLRAMEVMAAEARGATKAAQWWVGVVILPILSLLTAAFIGYLLYSVDSLKTSVAKMESDIRNTSDVSAAAKTQNAADVARLEKSIARLEDLVIKNRIFGTYAYEGKISKINGDELVIETSKEKKTLKLALDALVVVKGKKSMPSDLTVGMRVLITENADGQIEQIIALDHPSANPDR
jgi:hypothetical protein